VVVYLGEFKNTNARWRITRQAVSQQRKISSYRGSQAELSKKGYELPKPAILIPPSVMSTICTV